MFTAELDTKRNPTPLTIKCNRCGKAIAYIPKDSNRYERALTLEKAIADHNKNDCKITTDTSF